MDMGGTQLNLIAGLAALALGAGVLRQGAGEARNRLFALLCAALGLWNLGLVGNSAPWLPGLPWNQIFLAGSCMAAPISLHLALELLGRRGWLRRRLLPATYAISAGLWLTSWLPVYETHRQIWNRVVAGIAGSVAGLGLVLLAREVRRQPPGPLRRAYVTLLAATGLAVLGELSDFLPRGESGFPRVGVIFLLLLLVVVSAVLVRYRFLDINRFLARAAILLGGAALGTLALTGLERLSGGDSAVLFVGVLALMAAAVPLGPWLWRGAGGRLRRPDPVVETLQQVSRALASVRSAAELWRRIEDGRRDLPPGLELQAHMDSGEGTPFRPLPLGVGSRSGPEISRDDALPRVLAREQAPVTRHVLRTGGPSLRRGSGHGLAEALAQMERLGGELLVPLFRSGRLAGWIGLGGRAAPDHLSPEVATALMAAGHQALAALERLEAMERARRHEALAALGELSAGLAHELRNPVAAIQGACQALGPEATAEQAAEMRAVLSEEAARLERLVAEFLEYARPRPPRRRPCRLGDLARKVARRFEIAGVDLEILVAVTGGDPVVPADRDQIERVFENLARNAAEATGASGRLHVSVEPLGQERVVARFQDNGPGIPGELASRLFLPFQSGRPGGTGLGLALCHRIVAAHGGELRLEPGTGEGALFSVILPREEPSP